MDIWYIWWYMDIYTYYIMLYDAMYYIQFEYPLYICSICLLCGMTLKSSGLFLKKHVSKIVVRWCFPSYLPGAQLFGIFLEVAIWCYIYIYTCTPIYTYLSLSIYIYLYIYLYLSIPIYLYLSLSISISIYTYLYLSIPIYLYLSISIYLSLSIYIYIYLAMVAVLPHWISCLGRASLLLLPLPWPSLPTSCHGSSGDDQRINTLVGCRNIQPEMAILTSIYSIIWK